MLVRTETHKNVCVGLSDARKTVAVRFMRFRISNKITVNLPHACQYFWKFGGILKTSQRDFRVLVEISLVY